MLHQVEIFLDEAIFHDGSGSEIRGGLANENAHKCGSFKRSLNSRMSGEPPGPHARGGGGFGQGFKDAPAPAGLQIRTLPIKYKAASGRILHGWPVILTQAHEVRGNAAGGG
ncbi:hypothetical protein GCM10011587_08850 [Pyruvatibacter mobilis]|nr:hypothetical protein GCM10011587_08850 [Pyruvatibacter mobilis]